MTFAELNRAFKSKQRLSKIEEQKQASFDYILADLVGRSIARLYGSSNKLPSLAEAYPSLFDDEELREKEDQRRAERFAIQLKQFAQFHNKKFQEVGNEK